MATLFTLLLARARGALAGAFCWRSEADRRPCAAARSMRQGASAYSTVTQTWVLANCMVTGFYGRLHTE
jgi:hypothetical protein